MCFVPAQPKHKERHNMHHRFMPITLVIAAITVVSTTTNAYEEEDLQQLIHDNHCEECDLTNVGLRGRDFTGANVSGADLSGSDLRGTIWDNANLEGALLVDVDATALEVSPGSWEATSFVRANLTEAEVTGSDFSAALFDEATLTMLLSAEGTDFRSASFVRAVGLDMDLNECFFDGAVATRARFTGSYIRRTSFTSADFSGANIDGGDLAAARFDSATFAGAALSAALLTDCVFRGADFSDTVLESADLRRSVLDDANFARARAREVNIYHAQLYTTDFTGAELMDVDFTVSAFISALLAETDLRNSNLSSIHLSGLDMHGCDLRGAILIETDFVETDLSRAVLDGQVLNNNLRSVNLDEASLADVDFTTSVMTGASLRLVDLTATSLTDAYATRLDLTGAQCPGCDFTGEQFKEVIFDLAQLQGAHFDDGRLLACSLDGADLTGATFTGASFDSIVNETENSSGFIYNEYDRTTLHGATLIDVDASGANFEFAEFHGATMIGFQCDGCLGLLDLTDADLTDAMLTNMDFTMQLTYKGQLIIDGAEATGLQLDGSTISWFSAVAANLEEASFVGATVEWGSVDGANLFGSGFNDLEYDIMGFCDTVMPHGDFYSFWVWIMNPGNYYADYLAQFPEPDMCAEAPMGDLYSDFLTEGPADGDVATEIVRAPSEETVDDRDDEVDKPTEWDGDGKAPIEDGR